MEEDDNFPAFNELFQGWNDDVNDVNPPSEDCTGHVISHNLEEDPDEWVIPLDFTFQSDDDPLIRTVTYKEEFYKRLNPMTFEVTVRTIESDVFRTASYRRLISEEKRIHRVSPNFAFHSHSANGPSSHLPPFAKKESIA